VNTDKFIIRAIRVTFAVIMGISVILMAKAWFLPEKGLAEWGIFVFAICLAYFSSRVFWETFKD